MLATERDLWWWVGKVYEWFWENPCCCWTLHIAQASLSALTNEKDTATTTAVDMWERVTQATSDQMPMDRSADLSLSSPLFMSIKAQSAVLHSDKTYWGRSRQKAAVVGASWREEKKEKEKENSTLIIQRVGERQTVLEETCCCCGCSKSGCDRTIIVEEEKRCKRGGGGGGKD